MLLKSIGYAMLLSSLLGFSSIAHSKTKMYAAVAGGYLQGENDVSSAEGGSYKLSIGYELHPQWYLEASYQSLPEQDHLVAATVTGDTQSDIEPAFKGNIWGLSMLGKAGNRSGELFYRVGILAFNTDYQSLGSGADLCGSANNLSVSGTAYSLCENSASGMAGVIGLGFDYFIGRNMLIRIEAEHIEGEGGFNSDGGYVGIRYNF